MEQNKLLRLLCEQDDGQLVALGEGDGGRVYLSKDSTKVVKISTRVSSVAAKKEALMKKIAAMKTKKIPDIHEVYKCDAENYIVMDRVKGSTLERCINKNTLNSEQKHKISILLRNLLTKVHSVSVVHKDLDLCNIIVSKDYEDVYIVDFGYATLDGRKTQQSSDMQFLNFYLQSVEV